MRGKVLVVAVAAVGLIGPIVATGTGAGGAGDDAGARTSSVSWSAPAGTRGNLTVGWRIDAPADEVDCTMSVSASIRPGGENKWDLVVGVDTGTAFGYYATAYGVPEGRPAQVHHGGTVDSRDAAPDGALDSRVQRAAPEMTLQPPVNITATAFDVEPAASVSPMTVSLSCASPFDVVTPLGARGAVSWTHTAMREGTGGSVAAGLVDGAVLRDDRRERVLDADRVWFHADERWFNQTRVEGSLVLSAPDTSRSWQLGTDEFREIDVAGPGGSWEATLDLTAVGRDYELDAWLIPTSSLTSLEALG